jgi:peptidoglycan/xylan/chitin deacetylase (PgdA/CDA1 family)/CelD/BcsL family acetyltransferase involved in cellulose biosynthesis
MKVIEIRSEAELAALREAWNGLLSESASDTIFLTWEWVTAWWSAYGREDDLRIQLVQDDNGVLRGIAPLRRQTLSRYGRSLPALVFVGDGSADSDYLDFIIAAGAERPVMEALRRHWAADLAKGILLQFNELPEASPHFAILREWVADGWISSESDVPCSVVAMPGNWPDYLKLLAPRFRTKVRSVLRNLESQPGLRFRFCTDPAELDALLPELFELHRRRWAKESKPGVFQTAEKQRFYRQLSTAVMERGWLCFSVLEWKGRVLACQYGFIYGNRYFQLQEGYNPDCEHWNVGIALRAWSIQEFLQRGLSEYDFMAGTGRHKSDWGATVRLSKRITLGLPSAANFLYCRGPELVVKTRQAAKRKMPQRLLAVRDAQQEARRIAAFARPHDAISAAQEGAPARSILAKCYFYSPLPAAVRALSRRYQLRMARGGGLAGILRRRTEASVRILYYHRINDEGDAFFPATPTCQFEREIQLVSRHYRVVTMREAVKRLAQGGPAEPVVVITFDDGYEDNHRIAFPILKRYGVPATIFLTTGSIDSREPLWFERMALSIKKSPHASVDVELDVPRRFPLRNEQERLRANGELYWFLRNLPDAERRDHLDRLLRQFAGADAGERTGKMLTWDQVRSLHRHGIDFGGHTVSHPFVSRLSPQQARWEIGECKRRIETELQTAVDHFAYPSGREIDFAAWNKEMLRAAGYKAAVSTVWGVNYPATDRMELRRGQPWEVQPEVFAAKLDWYQWLDE